MTKYFLKIVRSLAKPLIGRHIGRNRLVKFFYGIVLRLLNPINVQGYKMFLDPKNDALDLLIKPDFETLEREIFKKYIKPGNRVIDIGANIGYHTLLMADLVGDKGRVYAFEPTPKVFNLLKKNIELNGFQNVALVQKAISNKTGTAKLYLCKSDGSNKIFDTGENKSFVEVETARLDDVVSGKVDFVKIDVEGIECLVLEGMPEILKQDVKLVLEFVPEAEKETGINPVKTLQLLKDFGFKIYSIRKSTKEIAEVKDIADIEEIRRGMARNLFCIKQYV